MAARNLEKVHKFIDIVSNSRVEEQNINRNCEQSFLNYSLSVITSRALPDLRDGLKPVHRRILYAAYEEKLFHNERFKKSATLVGAVMGSYHPHGDKSIYDALVRLSQDFKMRYPLLEGQGNFGSIDGDAPAAMRYTEIKMSKLGEKFLEGIKENCIDFRDNYDASKMEPVVLPVMAPSILLNGSEGIAVGMTTKIPPHNLKEICEAAIALIEDRNLSDEKLLTYIKGPDFPTGGEILGYEGIKKYLKEGKGKVRLRAKVEFDENKSQLIIREIPFGIIKSKLIKKIAELSTVEKNPIHKKNEILQRFVLNIRDESNLKEGIRLIIQCREGADLKVVLNNLYKDTNLQTQYTFNLTILNRGRPQLFGVGQILRDYLNHQVDMLKRRTTFNLNKVEKKIHLLEGRWAAVNNLREVIRIITEEDNPDIAIREFFSNPERKEKISLSNEQVNEIFSLTLKQLQKIERSNLKEELGKNKEERDEYKELLKSENRQLERIKKELRSLVDEYRMDKRKTQIDVVSKWNFDPTDLIPKETFVVILTDKNYISAILKNKIKLSGRMGASQNIAKEGITKYGVDIDCLVASSRDDLLVFTNLGRVFSFKAYWVSVSPDGKRATKPRRLNNLLIFKEKEKVIKIISIPKKEFSKDIYLLFATKFGIIKKTKISEFEKVMKNGKKAIKLIEGDQLKFVNKVDNNSEILLTSSANRTNRFDAKDPIVRTSLGRNTQGSKGINLKEIGSKKGKGNFLISASSTYEGNDVLVVTDRGHGRITSIEEYKKTKKKGGKGVITFKGEKDEKIVACVTINVSKAQEILLMTNKYSIKRITSEEIRFCKGRRTRGSALIKLKDDEKLVFFTKYQTSGEEIGGFEKNDEKEGKNENKEGIT